MPNNNSKFPEPKKTIFVHDGVADAVDVSDETKEKITVKGIGQQAVIRYAESKANGRLFVSGLDISKEFVHDGKAMFSHHLIAFGEDLSVLSENSIIVQEVPGNAQGETSIDILGVSAKDDKGSANIGKMSLPDKLLSGKDALPDDALQVYKLEKNPAKELVDVLSAVSEVKSAVIRGAR